MVGHADELGTYVECSEVSGYLLTLMNEERVAYAKFYKYGGKY